MSTREKILKIILNRQHCTIKELAEAVDINPISVRHHITRLNTDGLVNSKEERHGVGRPRRIYFLTDAGMELFPSRYLRLTNRLFDQLKENLPEETIEKLIRNMADGMADDLTADSKIDEVKEGDRLELLENLLTMEGFTVEITRQKDKVIIRETSCPYIHIGQDHPEVCILDETLIHKVLGTPVEQIKCMLDGDGYCTYEAALIPVSDIEAAEITS
jgi:predicted ArsR family transcriptional regulator